MKLNLPEGYLQRAGFTFNYEAALKMYYDRKDHRMLEWSALGGTCDHIQKRGLPHRAPPPSRTPSRLSWLRSSGASVPVRRSPRRERRLAPRRWTGTGPPQLSGWTPR